MHGSRSARPRTRTCTLALIALPLPATLAAQDVRPFIAPAEFTIDQWTTADGLPQNSVNTILQSRDGYLWVGTFGGLARFDGSEFTLMERRDASGRHVDRVLSLAEGREGTLWIGTENGLLRRRDGTYERYTTADGLPDNAIPALHVTDAGVLWIGGAGGGLARLAEGRVERFREVDGVPVDGVVSIVEDADGVPWVNLGDQGFLTIEDGVPTAARWRDRPGEGFRHMQLQDRSGGHWYRTGGDLVRWADGRGRAHPGPDPSVLVEDPWSGYWLGTNLDGLFHFGPRADAAGIRHYPLPDGTASYRVRSAHVDRDGNVWIGTDADGLLRARRSVFTTYATAHGLSHDVPTAVHVASDGTVWAGTNCAGLNAIDLRRRTVRLLKPRMRDDPAGDPCISALTEAPGGVIWVGTYGGGLTRIVDGRAERLYGAGGLPDSVVVALYADREGAVWAGTGSGGLVALEDGRVRTVYTRDDGLAHDGVRTIHQTRDGALWIGTLEGLTRLKDGRLTTYTAADGLSAGHIRAIHEDADGTLWIGTYGGGLNRFRDGVFTPIMRTDGLADNVVSAILEDDEGRFWTSGNRGIARVDRRDLVAFAEGEADRVHSVLYGVADGLLNPETNGGFQSAASKDAQGRLWFPTLAGLAVVDPGRVAVDERPPAVMVEEVVVDGVARPADDRLVLGPGRPNLEFRYTGLSLTDPKHLTFRYRLEGFEDEWVHAGTRRVAYYPRLPPGTYRFAVRAANRDGAWSEAGEGLALRVVPPFWRAWWFRLAVAAVAVALLGAGVRWRGRAARRDRAAQEAFSRRLIENQERERKRIAAELHDGLGQELLVVKNRALLALRVDGLDPAARDQLRQIEDVVTRSLENVRGLAHNLRPHQLEHLGLTEALEAMVEGVAETTITDVTCNIQDVDGLLTDEGEINLYRVVQEGAANIVRHSGARSAAIAVRRVTGALEVTLVDDGRGFDAEERRRARGGGRPGGGFGLPGMAERVRILGGRLEVVSAPGRGTRVRVVVPVRAEAEFASAPRAGESEA